ncbi:hypothetical protein VP01_2480g3 [Puccinia sorghi]|uniref:Uncharacterized protein n=1 Tax=Puccinia sorghi TaxID=27349 RepID=A0A0L6V6I4_9BASI|nr:hypothetical protein VP01_2480g3 [Puccinia sorghi]
MFNDFLYVKFQEDAMETFVTDIKVSIKKLVDVGIEIPKDILAYLVLFKFPALLQNLKQTSPKTTEAALFSSKGKSKSTGNEYANRSNQSNTSKRCKTGYHNPKQDKNHSANDCWYLHPEIAPEWWCDSQAEWKASKEKEKTNYFMSLLTFGALAHIFNEAKFFEHIETGEFEELRKPPKGPQNQDQKPKLP